MISFHKRLVLLPWFALSLALVVKGDPIPAPATSEPRPAEPAVEATGATMMPGKSGLLLNKNKTTTPFVLRRELGTFPSTPIEHVRFFEGMSAFREFVKKEKLTAWPIADFHRKVVPEDEVKHRDVLRAHAANCGADYVVILTDADEIEKDLHALPMDMIVYGALAYKRAEAHIGFVRDKDAAEKLNQIKVLDFAPGTLAQEGGLRIADVIKTIDGTVPGGAPYWKKALRWKAGEKVKMEVERDGKTVEIEVKLVAD